MTSLRADVVDCAVEAEEVVGDLVVYPWEEGEALCAMFFFAELFPGFSADESLEWLAAESERCLVCDLHAADYAIPYVLGEFVNGILSWFGSFTTMYSLHIRSFFLGFCWSKRVQHVSMIDHFTGLFVSLPGIRHRDDWKCSLAASSLLGRDIVNCAVLVGDAAVSQTTSSIRATVSFNLVERTTVRRRA